MLLVYGGGSIKRIGLYDKVMATLRRPESTYPNFRRGAESPAHDRKPRCGHLQKEHIDVLLAVGGGSTIDCTKAIAAAAFYDGDCWDLVKQKAPVTKLFLS